MSEIGYLYTKRRRQFGTQTYLSDTAPSLIASISRIDYDVIALQQKKPATASATTTSTTTPRINVVSITSSADATPSLAPTPRSATAATITLSSSPHSSVLPSPTNRTVTFSDGTSIVLSAAPPAADSAPEPCYFIESLRTTIELDCIRSYSSAEVNTDPILTSSKGTLHTTGAWPKDVDQKSFDSVQRYKRKQEKSPQFAEFVTRTARMSLGILQGNNTVDLYEMYFSGNGMIGLGEDGKELQMKRVERYDEDVPQVKVVTVFRDLSTVTTAVPATPTTSSNSATALPHPSTSRHPHKRRLPAAQCVSWNADATKFAVAYCPSSFPASSSSSTAAIWSVSLGCIIHTLSLPSAAASSSPPIISCLAFHPSPSHAHLLLASCTNGLVAVYDLLHKTNRRAEQEKELRPMRISNVLTSHSECVSAIEWLPSPPVAIASSSVPNDDSNTSSSTDAPTSPPPQQEFVTISIDGTVKYWNANDIESGPIMTVDIAKAAPSPMLTSTSIFIPVACTSLAVISYHELLVGTGTGDIYYVCRFSVADPSQSSSSTVHLLIRAAHHGLIRSIAVRQPDLPTSRQHRLTQFITIGDWTAKVWSLERNLNVNLASSSTSPSPSVTVQCLLTTPPHSTPFTRASWSSASSSSSSRIWFVCTSDGALFVYDLSHHSPHLPIAQTQVTSSCALTTMTIDPLRSEEILVGSTDADVTLVRFNYVKL